MCGISGIFGDEGLEPSSRRETLEAMNGCMAFRGPDERGTWVGPGAGLGNVRLSIVDLTHGHQPMHSEDGTLHIVFNGEVYNHPELRRGLEPKGHRFRTSCDTEVLLHLYEEEGPDFVGKLNGQFAFLIWDARRRQLFGARDRLGVRPIFHHAADSRLIVSSTIRGILETGLVDTALDTRVIRDVFTFWVPLPGETVFRGIGEIPPGHTFTWSPARGLEIRRYWDMRFPAAGDLPPLDRNIQGRLREELLDLLRDAVRLRLRADVPVGAYLSGGIDSSLIASLIHEVHPFPLCTFSIGFEEPGLDETRYQDIMVAQLGTNHRRTVITSAEVAGRFEEVVRHCEVPLLRTGPVPMLSLSRLVRESGYKVVLTGEGADEFCAGYNIFKENQVRRFWARQPDSTRRPRLFERLYPFMGDRTKKTGLFWSRFFARGLQDTCDPFYSHRIRWTEGATLGQYLREDLPDEPWDGYERLAARLPGEFADWHPLGQAQYLEALLFLPGYILSSQGDRMMMAHSVEGRFPFLDHRLVEFLNGLHPRAKLFGLQEKHLLKRAAGGRIPPEIIARPKQPYRGPSIADAILGNGGGPAAEMISSPALADSGLFAPDAVNGLTKKIRDMGGARTGNRDIMAFLGILSTQVLWQYLAEVRRSGLRLRSA